jgi:putative tricarboxylic transport membrane protein
MQDLIAGRIDYLCDSPSTSRPQIETNNIKAIATTGANRSSVLPDVPTAREQGLDFEVMAWQGLFLPKETGEPIVRRLNEALSAALDLQFVRERFKAVGEDVPSVEREGDQVRRHQAAVKLPQARYSITLRSANTDR